MQLIVLASAGSTGSLKTFEIETADCLCVDLLVYDEKLSHMSINVIEWPHSGAGDVDDERATPSVTVINDDVNKIACHTVLVL